VLHEGREEFHRQRQEGGRVVLAGDFFHGLEEAQLQRDGLGADHGRGLHQLFRRLEFRVGAQFRQ